MALITCPECGKQVSDQAASCPGCGCPLKKDVSFHVEMGSVKTAGPAVGPVVNVGEYEKDTLFTTKLVLGIISLVMFLFVGFQSCSASLLTQLGQSSDLGGSAGSLLAVILLVCGILGIAGRRNRKATLTAGILYIVGGVLAIPNAQIYKDLILWGIVSIAFGVVFVISARRMRDWEMAVEEKAAALERERVSQESAETERWISRLK